MTERTQQDRDDDLTCDLSKLDTTNINDIRAYRGVWAAYNREKEQSRNDDADT